MSLLEGRFRRAFAVLATVSVLLVGVACGDDDDGEPADSSPTPAPTTAPTEAPVDYPVTVTDLLGRTVEIPARPQAVVALSPTAGELVYAAGGTLVGRASSVQFPEEAKVAEEVGSAYQPNFEAILALSPDLIVADSVIHASPNFRGPLEALDVPLIFAGADSYQGVLDGLALMGEVFADSEKTNEVIAGIEQALSDAKGELAGDEITAVVLISDRDQVLYAAKPNSYAGDVLARLGITNSAADEPDAGPFPGYSALAPERLIQFNPDLVITVTPAPPPAPRLGDLFMQIPPFQALDAVQQGRVVEIDVNLLLQAPGPRLAEALRAVADAATGQ